MVAEDLADLLSTGGVGTVATDLFVGDLPASPVTAMAVRATGGYAPIHTMASSPGLAVVERPSVQVVFRADTHNTATCYARQAFLLLDGHPGRLINGVKYLYLSAAQSPGLLYYDENDRAIYGFNVDVQKVLTTT